MKDLNTKDIKLVSGGCEDSRSLCIPHFPGQPRREPPGFPFREPWVIPFPNPILPPRI